jgi:hypothetical protein
VLTAVSAERAAKDDTTVEASTLVHPS